MFRLGFFALEGNPSFFMRELYYGCAMVCVFSEQEIERETMRENREYYSGSVVGFVFSFCWIIERKD